MWSCSKNIRASAFRRTAPAFSASRRSPSSTFPRHTILSTDARGALRRARRQLGPRRRRPRQRGGRRSRDVRSGARRLEPRRRRELHSSARVRAIAISDAGVTITADGGAARSRRARCILACGANYRFNRAARARRAADLRPERAARAIVRRTRTGRGASSDARWRRAASRGWCRSCAAGSRISALRPDGRGARRHALPLVRRRSCARASASRTRSGRSRASRSCRSVRSAKTYGPAPARGRRRGRARQADDRRRHLLQPDQRPVRRRDPRRGAQGRRPPRVASANHARPDGASGSAPRSASASRSACSPRASTTAASTRSSSSPGSTASSRCCGRPPTSTGIASPRSPCSAIRNSAASCSRPSGADARSQIPGRRRRQRRAHRGRPLRAQADPLPEPRRRLEPRQPVRSRAPAGGARAKAGACSITAAATARSSRWCTAASRPRAGRRRARSDRVVPRAPRRPSGVSFTMTRGSGSVRNRGLDRGHVHGDAGALPRAGAPPHHRRAAGACAPPEA